MTLHKVQDADVLPPPWLQKTITNIRLKTHDISLSLDLPGAENHPVANGTDSDATCDNRSQPLKSVLLAHEKFKASLFPQDIHSESFAQSCRLEVKAIELFFPGALSDQIRICFAAWLAFACAMDDVLETLPSDLAQTVLYACLEIIQERNVHNSDNAHVFATDTRIQRFTRILHRHITQHLPPVTCMAFFREVCNVFYAHMDEVMFLDGRIPQDFHTYMTVRSRTISLNPFFEVIKSEYFPASWQSNAAWESLQKAVSSAAGLQNDLMGLERDIQNGENLNAVVVLMRSESSAAPLTDEEGEALLTRCVDSVVYEHNRSVETALIRAKQIAQSSGRELPAAVVAGVVRHIVTLGKTHLRWCASAKRYMVRSD